MREATIVVYGGLIQQQSDAWISRDHGVSFTILPTPPWSGRAYAGCTTDINQNIAYMVGGIGSIGSDGFETVFDDVYSTSDRGTSWQLISHLPTGGRGRFGFNYGLYPVPSASAPSPFSLTATAVDSNTELRHVFLLAGGVDRQGRALNSILYSEDGVKWFRSSSTLDQDVNLARTSFSLLPRVDTTPVLTSNWTLQAQGAWYAIGGEVWLTNSSNDSLVQSHVISMEIMKSNVLYFNPTCTPASTTEITTTTTMPSCYVVYASEPTVDHTSDVFPVSESSSSGIATKDVLYISAGVISFLTLLCCAAKMIPRGVNSAAVQQSVDHSCRNHVCEYEIEDCV